MAIGRLCIAGVGLIGGSLALALRAAGAVGEIVGTGRRAAPLERAVALGVIDRYELEPARAAAGAEVVLLGVPLGAVRPVLAGLRPGLGPETVITDVGSAKGCVVADAAAVFGGLPARFVPGHPIAGTEKSGVEAAFATLFRGRRVILTPGETTDAAALATVRGLWTAAGADVVTMGVDAHDRMLAGTSHLPHLLAFGLVDMLARSPDREEIFQYAAGGFRDFTRIASSDPVMWRDVCLGNREALLAAFAAYREDLERLTAMVAAADGEALEAVFRNAKHTRDRHLHIFER